MTLHCSTMLKLMLIILILIAKPNLVMSFELSGCSRLDIDSGRCLEFKEDFDDVIIEGGEYRIMKTTSLETEKSPYLRLSSNEGTSVELETVGGNVLHDPGVFLIYYGVTEMEKLQLINTFVSNFGKSDW